MIKNVQKRFEPILSGLSNTNYDGKLRELWILCLENGWRYFDIIETYKCIKVISNVEYRSWFTLVGDMNRRDTRCANCPLNIIPNKTRLLRKNFSWSLELWLTQKDNREDHWTIDVIEPTIPDDREETQGSNLQMLTSLMYTRKTYYLCTCKRAFLPVFLFGFFLSTHVL